MSKDLGTQHVFDLLAAKDVARCTVYVAAGADPFLKQLATEAITARITSGDDADVLDGATVQWRDVADQLSMLSLFGDGARVVLVREADPFLKAHRQRLETVVEESSSTGHLILCLESLPANTRLFKLLAKHGVHIDCNPPTTQRGKRKEPDEKRSLKWIRDWAAQRHQVKVAANGAQQLWDLVGPVYGLLDQELAKLALYVEPDQSIDSALVAQVVGGWRTQTTWEMIDAAISGDTATALEQLDQLLSAGEHPNALFGQISWSLRRYAGAARSYQLAERAGQRLRLHDALRQAGFRWQAEIDAAERNIRKLGRQRAIDMADWLLDVDLALKSTHSAPDRARFKLEWLMYQVGSRGKG